MIGSRKKAIAVVVTILGLTATHHVLSNGSKQYGPFACDACLVAPYMPDTNTAIFLATFERQAARGALNKFFIAVGDTITICNASYCTTYQKTDSGDYMGQGTNSNEPAGGGGGGGGGSSGRPGAGMGGGGSGGGRGGTGTVTVGPPKQEQAS